MSLLCAPKIAATFLTSLTSAAKPAILHFAIGKRSDCDFWAAKVVACGVGRGGGGGNGPSLELKGWFFSLAAFAGQQPEPSGRAEVFAVWGLGSALYVPLTLSLGRSLSLSPSFLFSCHCLSCSFICDSASKPFLLSTPVPTLSAAPALQRPRNPLIHNNLK